MAGLVLDRQGQVWRMLPTGTPGQTSTQVAYQSIRCAIVPISNFDEAEAYGYVATHVMWVPRWLQLLREDEVHSGRRLPDATGRALPKIYVVNGLRRVTQGIPQLAYYVRERD